MFDEKVKFKYTFRPYQERTLKQIQLYLKDKKIHVVAAPGSGKTILGLEIARMLNQPVLILSPTVTIKHQWIDRFMTSFTEFKTVPDWISTDIYHLAFFNVVTYQALHYAYKKTKIRNVYEDTDDVIMDSEVSINSLEQIKSYELIEEIKKHNIKTIILDEAHHLKSEWWNSLDKVIRSLNDVNIIALTATPPYDSDFATWRKYIGLCGDIDAEITVPELVKAHNLCPHQDYIYFNEPTVEEKKIISQYDERLKNVILKIKQNKDFTTCLINHKYIKSPFLYEEELLDNVEYYSSILIYLHDQNVPISRDNLKILGDISKIPSLDISWLEILLKNVIFNDRKSYQKYESVIKQLELELHNVGAIDKGMVSFTNNQVLEKNFLNSMGKLDSISHILEIERSSLRHELRMVILTDYIRKEYLDVHTKINKLGVISIFRTLIEKYPDIDMAVLTGSLFIVPKRLEINLRNLCIENGVDDDLLKFEPLELNMKYAVVNMPSKIRNNVMSYISKLFSIGLIHVIIGTKSLLGEGWDEPSINSLVLASFVGSFMLSNQMRGRAIRVNSNPNKTANIWHLVCVTNNEEVQLISNPDYQMLQRRFKAFVGLDYNKDIIESGIDRLSIINDSFTKETIELINSHMEGKASNRTSLINAWNKALNNITSFDMVSVATAEKLVGIKKSWFINRKLILLIGIFLLIFFLVLFGSVESNLFLQFVEIFLGIYLGLTFYKIYKMSKGEFFIKSVGLVTLNSLVRVQCITTPRSKIKLNVKNDQGIISCYITGVTQNESNLFTTSIKEIFSKTVNQRYIIARLTSHFKELNDYYNVPTVLSNNKENALIFSKYWKDKIGEHNLIYTRTSEGRRMLLKARMSNLSINDQILNHQEFY